MHDHHLPARAARREGAVQPLDLGAVVCRAPSLLCDVCSVFVSSTNTSQERVARRRAHRVVARPAEVSEGRVRELRLDVAAQMSPAVGVGVGGRALSGASASCSGGRRGCRGRRGTAVPLAISGRVDLVEARADVARLRRRCRCCRRAGRRSRRGRAASGRAPRAGPASGAAVAQEGEPRLPGLAAEGARGQERKRGRREPRARRRPHSGPQRRPPTGTRDSSS